MINVYESFQNYNCCSNSSFERHASGILAACQRHARHFNKIIDRRQQSTILCLAFHHQETKLNVLTHPSAFHFFLQSKSLTGLEPNVPSIAVQSQKSKGRKQSEFSISIKNNNLLLQSLITHLYVSTAVLKVIHVMKAGKPRDDASECQEFGKVGRGKYSCL